MLRLLPEKFSIQPIIDQVNTLGNFGKRLDLNVSSGKFFNDPWQVKQEFANTPLGNVLKTLGNIGQARLLCLESAESYTAHCDPDDRIHLAIITNPYSFLVDVENKNLYHLPVDGSLWHMDTGKIHVAANWGGRTRIHLNVRKLLPKYDASQPGLHIKVLEGDYDWKQIAYTPLMSLINSSIKNNLITGFEGLGEKEVLLNTSNPEIFKSVIEKITKAGVQLAVINL